MKKWFGKEIKIALSVLASILILYVGINYLKGINVMKPANYYYVQFTNVAGLAQSAPVMIDGYKVGLVQEILYDYDTNGSIKVLLNLDKKLKIPVDSKAFLETDMLGTASIVIKLNPHVSEYYEHGAVLKGEVNAGLMQNIQGELLPQVALLMPKLGIAGVGQRPGLVGFGEAYRPHYRQSRKFVGTVVAIDEKRLACYSRQCRRHNGASKQFFRYLKFVTASIDHEIGTGNVV